MQSTKCDKLTSLAPALVGLEMPNRRDRTYHADEGFAHSPQHIRIFGTSSLLQEVVVAFSSLRAQGLKQALHRWRASEVGTRHHGHVLIDSFVLVCSCTSSVVLSCFWIQVVQLQGYAESAFWSTKER